MGKERRETKTILVVSIIVVVALLFIGQTYIRFSCAMHGVQKRLLSGSRIIETTSGPIEYAVVGQGFPVLMLHGAGGGYDHGLLMLEVWVGDGFQWIAVSRFGYLRTALPADASPSAQADACAELLDSLNIERVAVIGASAGGPPSLQFSLRHPDRCAALVMIAALSKSRPLLSSSEKNAFRTIFGSDFIYWFIVSNFRAQLYTAFGIPKETQAELTKAQRDSIDIFLQYMHPVSLRQAGIFNDIADHAFECPLHQITTPTLVIHAVDDPLVPFNIGEYTATSIPGAKLVALERGGHMLVGQNAKVKAEIVDFLQQHIQQ